MNKIVEKVWDYSKNAEFYKYRPNYSPKAISMLMDYVGAKTNNQEYSVADIGAGTGNLTILLLDKGLSNVTAVEPNDEMRKIGEQVTGDKAKWIRATATETTLSGKYDWVTFGSSFNVIDRKLALKETSRILKDGGFFTCMWNHRDLECPIQKTAEKIVESIVPNYERGVRREDQRPFLEKNANEFNDICYIEVDFSVERTIDEYILAWKSVKNKYWDLETEEGGGNLYKNCQQNKRRVTRDIRSALHHKSMDYAKRLQVRPCN